MTKQHFDERIAIVGANNVIMAKDAGLPDTIVKNDMNNFAPRCIRVPSAEQDGSARRVWHLLRDELAVPHGRICRHVSVLDYGDVFCERHESAAGYGVESVSTDRKNAPSGVTTTSGQASTTPRNQYIQSWNMTIEKEVGRGNVFEIAYSGSKGTHLQRRYDINQPFRQQELRTLRPYPAFGAINIISDSSNSIYNAGSLTFRRRFSKQLFVRAAYTYAKSLDESSNTGGTIQYNFPWLRTRGI